MRPNTLEVYDPKHDRTRTYNLENPKDVLRYAARTRFAWPGGYELLVDFPDGSTLCSGCIVERFKEELQNLEPGDKVFLYGSQDVDPDGVFCEHCSKDVSAYTD